MNFYDLDEASLELSKAAVAEAPPLSPAATDVISTLLGITPADLQTASHR